MVDTETPNIDAILVQENLIDCNISNCSLEIRSLGLPLLPVLLDVVTSITLCETSNPSKDSCHRCDISVRTDIRRDISLLPAVTPDYTNACCISMRF